MLTAAFQRYPVFDSPETVGEILRSDLLWAETRGVDLAVFPECYLHGHAYDHATIEQRAVRLDGQEVKALLKMLAPIQVVAVIGLFERRGGEIYNSAVVIQSGRILGVYAKAHPNEAGIASGSVFPVFDLGGRRFGINICNDANHPDGARRLADSGATSICYPLNNLLKPAVAERWRSRSITNLQSRAVETGCWVVSADVAGRHVGLLSYGCTAIVRPDGAIAARVPELTEGVAVHDLT